MKRAFNLVLTNAAVVVGLCVLIEFGAWATIAIYYKTRLGTRDASGVEFVGQVRAVTNAEDPEAQYSAPGVSADIERHKDRQGSPYHYESYLVFQNRPYASNYLNIAPDGMRLNGPNPRADRGAMRIWVFGSSPVFGATNGDSETIPAALEQALERRSPGRTFNVSNFGVVGYTSWQDLLHFALRLSEQKKPDLVIFINGHNDHTLGWLSETQACERLLETAVGSYEALQDGWEARAAQRLVAWPILRARFTSLFSNTLELGKLTRKYFELKSANRDINSWKESYRRRRESASAVAGQCIPRAEEIYLRNMTMAMRLATDNGIAFAVAPQPMLYSTKKPLVGLEAVQAEHPDYTTFALDDAQLAVLKDVPTYRIDQEHVWNKAAYIATYRKQNERLRDLAKRIGVRFIDLDPAIDGAGRVAIFSTSIHFTFRGTRLIGEVLAEQTIDLLRPKTSD